MNWDGWGGFADYLTEMMNNYGKNVVVVVHFDAVP